MALFFLFFHTFPPVTFASVYNFPRLRCVACVLACLVPVSCFPALVTCFAWGRFPIFPRLPPVVCVFPRLVPGFCFPALPACCTCFPAPCARFLFSCCFLLLVSQHLALLICEENNSRSYENLRDLLWLFEPCFNPIFLVSMFFQI